MPLLEVAGVHKHFGAVAAVDDVSLNIKRGSRYSGRRAAARRPCCG